MPLILMLWSPESMIAKQAWIIGVKLVLMIPVSSLAYEFIRLASRFQSNWLCRAMSAPGMFMQLLTTHEPDDSQLEVAIRALQGACAKEA